MAGVVSGVAIAVNFLCDVCMLSDSVDALITKSDRGENCFLETATVVNALALVGFSIAEISGILSGQKSEFLRNLKEIELIPRLFNVPIQTLSEVVKAAEEGPDIELSAIIRIVEKGFLSPMADMCRTAAAADAYYEQHFLDMTQEELKKAKRPIYERDYSGDTVTYKIVGYKPVDPAECRANLAKLQMDFAAATVVRIATYDRVVEKVVCDLTVPTFQRLAAFLGIYRPAGGGGAGGGAAVVYLAPAAPYAGAGDGAGGVGEMIPDEGGAVEAPHRVEEEHGGAAAAPHHVEEERELPLNLLEYPNIPVPLHGDQVFRQNICPITLRPIRDPVRDPNGVTLYERSAILNWLRYNAVSPITRRPLAPDQLLEDRLTRNLIDRRLQEYQEGLQHFIDGHLETPAVR